MDTTCQCGAIADGYKCGACGAEFEAKPSDHECGSDIVQVKCSECGDIADNCLCA